MVTFWSKQQPFSPHNQRSVLPENEIQGMRYHLLTGIYFMQGTDELASNFAMCNVKVLLLRNDIYI